MRIGIVVGEASGDILGAALMQSIKKYYPDCHFEGIGGQRMLAQGFTSFFPQDRLAVMGLLEPLKRLPELLKIQKTIKQHFLNHPPDLFLGIDAPDFNLAIEVFLRERGIKTAHYVSPTIWAWRQGRIKKIARAVDLMLCIFPFEKNIYQEHNVPVAFVGHPLADAIPLAPESQEAITTLGLEQLSQEHTFVALLPGSRASEVEHLASTFFDAAMLCLEQQPQLFFLIPAVNEKRYEQLMQVLTKYPALPYKLFHGCSRDVMAASEHVIAASGTTTLEALLLKKSMVIAYKAGALSYAIISRMVKVENVGLPNLLAGERLVPELIQQKATAENIASSSLKYLQSEQERRALVERFYDIHKILKCNASDQAAKALLALIGKNHA